MIMHRNCVNATSIASELESAYSIEDYVSTLVTYLDESGQLHFPITDIHIDTDRPPSIVSNDVHYFVEGPAVPGIVIDSMIRHLRPAASESLHTTFEADGRFFRTGNQGITRMHVYHSGDGAGDSYSAALRLQPRSPYKWDEMGLPAHVKAWLDRPQGLIIFSGPVGSRKTSAAHALIDAANRRIEKPQHIILIEDPPEFAHEQIGSLFHQREIGHTALDFPTAVIGALRVKHDLMLIGELRSFETIEAGLTAARLGKKVITTVHSETTVKTIARITQAFPPGRRDDVIATLKDNLIGIVNLRPVPRVDGGLVLAYEILSVSSENNDLIDEPDQLIGKIENSRDGSSNTLEHCLSELTKEGIISPDTARQYAPDPTRLRYGR
jgi:twitching motility protein PilT